MIGAGDHDEAYSIELEAAALRVARQIKNRARYLPPGASDRLSASSTGMPMFGSYGVYSSQ
jgi:hypothetical protein